MGWGLMTFFYARRGGEFLVITKTSSLRFLKPPAAPLSSTECGRRQSYSSANRLDKVA